MTQQETDKPINKDAGEWAERLRAMHHDGAAIYIEDQAAHLQELEDCVQELIKPVDYTIMWNSTYRYDADYAGLSGETIEAFRRFLTRARALVPDTEETENDR